MNRNFPCTASVAGILRSLGRSTKLSFFHAEDIGLHYAETLKQRRVRFLLHLDEVKALGLDDKFLRMWEYYLSYCEGTFRERHIGDMQLVLTKHRAEVPLINGVLNAIRLSLSTEATRTLIVSQEKQ